MNLTIRKLKPADSQAYRLLRLELLAKNPTSFSSSFEEESQQLKLRFEQIIEKEAPDAFMMGAFLDDQLVGICGFSQETRQKVRHRAQLNSIYVQAKYAGRGIGQRLVQKTIEAAFNRPELEQLELGVMAGNVAANALYERLGFEEYGVLQNELKFDNQYFHLRLMRLSRPTSPSNNQL